MSVLDLPSTRQEAWRWADMAALEAAAAAPRVPALAAQFLDLGGARLVFVDGVFDTAQSMPGRVAVEALNLATDHPLGSRATGTGWTLTLSAAQAEISVEIVHVSTGGKNHVPARIALAEDAVASVVETFVGTGWANRLTQVTLAKAARLQRAVRILHDDGFVSTRDEVQVGEGASYVATVLGAGGMASRVDAQIDIVGDAGFAEMGGALLTRDALHQECAVAIRHAAPNGASHQTWRAVAADRSQASLAARVEVARDAQKTDGVQSLRGILLKRTATINLKPELEIFADDVKCAHGATVGELDARALFYLASRGIAPAKAQAMLTRAFVADALDRIGDEAVREAFAADADAWLEAAL
ncbi:SufD family Fe-S cluster assembly protein [Sphingomonas donggukensis]|uniref:SufD family Fe-S cluster assembly protein n=1 Tax=Sphingomonas donggukensis TaxID=2949093 RepID=A0ABY4TTI4_9SPHN|nr:SufD family Fe-S cluster assembly protein [Sphingomonas donggukensis]URW74509.1 SufD family Fe-S cluster assembly protein [Sphingomonas donggukensis]